MAAFEGAAQDGFRADISAMSNDEIDDSSIDTWTRTKRLRRFKDLWRDPAWPDNVMGLYNLHYKQYKQSAAIHTGASIETRNVMSTQKQMNNHSRNMKCYKAST